MNYPIKLDSLAVDPQPVKRGAWPFYVVFDVSQSMWDPERWRGRRSPHAIMNDSLALIMDSLRENFDAMSIGWLGIVTFANDASTAYPLRPIKETRAISPLPQGGWTNYMAVWRHLKATISEDVRSLQQQGHKLMQPVVFFITDGNAGAKDEPQPIAMWKPLHEALCTTTVHERPRIVALGMGDVNRDTVLAIRSLDPPGPACIADPGEPASALLNSIIHMIIHSIKNSAGNGTFEFEVPAGMTRLDEG